MKLKVLKFGGTSVGSEDSILRLKKIVEQEAANQQVVVVVSALGGITDRLIKTGSMALAGDASWRDEFDAIESRHRKMIESVIDKNKQPALTEEIDALFEQLRSIYFGVFLIHDLSPKTEAAIVSYGERLSSRIVTALIEGAERKNARDFIFTFRKGNKQMLDVDLTNNMVKEAFSDASRISVVPGFISRDRNSRETTNLGRGGSDYTAAIIAGALDADVLEIWTDVDGFMTADPRVIKSAYTINELSYREAMELCNFGAKVIYPPTIYPVCVKNIPVKVKNTFNPENPGTIIRNNTDNDNKPIKGISSIPDTTLITVAGLSMVGVIGVNRRIFSSLADNGISCFMVSQASSENSTSIGVSDMDADHAVEVLNQEFAKEIETGAMFPMYAERNLAAIAIVGENMKHTPGIAGKLFGTLGRSGISVIACAQGASETNISFVVEGKWLKKALNVIHDSFFLSEYKVLNLFICGVGTVGNMLIQQIHSQYEELMKSSRLKLNVVGIASSKHAVFNREGLPLENYRNLLEASAPSNVEKLKSEILKMNIFNSVFVDCTASPEVAGIYRDLLEHNVSVVAANKIAASSDYDNYSDLKQTAIRRGVKFLFETNVGAGLPIINTINDLRNSGDRILKIEAVLSGTLNYIFNVLSSEIPFSKAVKMAKEAGYSEPDPRLDLSGKDVIRKIVILAREAGYHVEQSDVVCSPIIPGKLFEGLEQEFWEKLPSVDADFEERRKRLHAEKKQWRFVAELNGGNLSVGLRECPETHPFYVLSDSNNIVLITTERYRQYPMLIQGYGAGAEVTAAGVFANIMSIANI